MANQVSWLLAWCSFYHWTLSHKYNNIDRDQWCHDNYLSEYTQLITLSNFKVTSNLMVTNRHGSILNPLLPVCSRNSTIAFIVLESASAINQNNLVRPQPSWRSTFIASSSSLKTYYIIKKRENIFIYDPEREVQI